VDDFASASSRRPRPRAQLGRRTCKAIDSQQGALLEPWDWNRYAEQIRKTRYDVDESQIKPYFELNRVLTDGVFFAAHRLYGLTFKERKDIPVYEQDVRVFEVIDANGSPLALFYADYFKRDNKNGGAWMDNFVGQSKLLAKPVITTSPISTSPRPGSLRCSPPTTW
jgi:peptidyl-dipeptidase Dcp